MDINEIKTLTLKAEEGCYLTQKVVEADNFRTFSKAITIGSEGEASLYEEWTEGQMRAFYGEEEQTIEPIEEEQQSVEPINNIIEEEQYGEV